MKDSELLNGKIPVERVKFPMKRNAEKIRHDNNRSSEDKCHRCGYKKHPYDICPARDSSCNFCNTKGHWKSMCRKLKSENKNSKDEKKNFAKHVKSTYMINVRSTTSEQTPRVQLKCSTLDNGNSCILNAIPDTGAEASICGPDILKKLNIDTTGRSDNEKLIAANGLPIKTRGKIRVKLNLENIKIEENVIICDNQKELLLSWRACKRLKIIHEDFPRPIKAVQRKSNIKEAINHKKMLLKEFSDVFTSTDNLTAMKGKDMKIHLKEDAVPSAIFTPRQIPFKWSDEVKKTLDKMVSQNIIRPVTDSPTDWCHPMVVVPKSNNKVRICVDFKQLKKFVKRPTYPTTTPREAVMAITPQAKYFSTLDMTQGYYQIALDEESQLLTTFLTPFGRYCFLRAPMGLSSTGDESCRRGDEAIQGIHNVKKVVDDMIVYDSNYDEHYHHVRELLQRCRDKGITLNPNKFNFAEENVKFVGYSVTSEGIEADPEKISAIEKFPKPSNISELRSFLGLVNQLSEFSQEISTKVTPLRGLLSQKNKYQWLPVMIQHS